MAPNYIIFLSLSTLFLLVLQLHMPMRFGSFYFLTPVRQPTVVVPTRLLLDVPTIQHVYESTLMPGHSGYPIRIIQNLGNENCYPILVPKKHYPQFRVPDNSGSGIPDLPEFQKTTHYTNFQQQFV